MSTLREIAEHGEWEVSRRHLQLGKMIGEGSFGCVYNAMWRGTPVAAKLLPDVVSNECMLEFRTELDTLSRLHHPNIVQLLGACTIEEPYVILMEHMPHTLASATLTDLEKVSVAIDILRGLAYMHNRSPDYIIHRDLKPTNILLTVSKKAKLADFGISMLQKDKTTMYAMTGETGSYRYMAPEVLRHESYNYQVDVWSFGMILYYMFEEVPFLQYDLHSMIVSIANYKTPAFFTCDNKQVRNICCMCWKIASERPEALDLLPLVEKIQIIPPIQTRRRFRLCS